jgi:hypothetical protein
VKTGCGVGALRGWRFDNRWIRDRTRVRRSLGWAALVVDPTVKAAGDGKMAGGGGE